MSRCFLRGRACHSVHSLSKILGRLSRRHSAGILGRTMMGWLAIQAWYGNELFGVYWVTRGGLWSVDAPFWTAPTVHQILVTLGGLGSLNLGTATMLPKTF
jgi:hypothetical protein